MKFKRFKRLFSAFSRKPKQNDYFRTESGFYAHVKGPNHFIKSYWENGKFVMEEVILKHKECGEIFIQPLWYPITKKQYDKHIEPVAASNRGVRGQKSVEFVFEVDGVKYFRYADLQDYPIGRMQELEGVIMELNFMMDRGMIDDFFALLLAESGGEKGSVNLGKIRDLIREADNRRRLGFDSNLWRKIGTVLFFTEDEDTSRIDFAGMRDKLKSWEKLPDSFFFGTPLRDYLPFEGKSNEDLKRSLLSAKAKLNLLNANLERLSKDTLKASTGK